MTSSSIYPLVRTIFAVALFYLLGTVRMFGQDVVLDRVSFNSLPRDWVEIEIQITCQGNSSPEARNKDFLENIKIRPYLAYPKGSSPDEFVYFTAEVEILIMEKSDSNNVYFYLPGLLMERDNLKFPEYYYIEIEVNGEPLTPENEAFDGISSTSIPNFKTKVESGSEPTKHALMPVYLAPNEYQNRARKLPIFVRRDPAE
ncbi:MAG: hypothetical protein ACON39_00845 [Coraliomargaritaceae bacterium]